MSTTVIENHVSEHNHSVSNPEDVQVTAFQALEQRVLRAIDLLRTERELRAAAEQRASAAEAHFVELEMRLEDQASRSAEQAAQHQGHAASLTQHIDEHSEQIKRLEGELALLSGERDQVRERVERILHHLDEFTA